MYCHWTTVHSYVNSRCKLFHINDKQCVLVKCMFSVISSPTILWSCIASISFISSAEREFVMIPTKLTKQAWLLINNKGRCLIIREVVPNANHRAHGVHPLCKRCLPPLLCSPPPPPCFNYPEEVAARQIARRPLTPRSSSAADQLQNSRSNSSLPLSNLHRASTTGAHA